MTTAAFVPDLMDRSRLPGTVQQLSSLDALAACDADLVLVDLSRRGVLDRLPDTRVGALRDERRLQRSPEDMLESASRRRNQDERGHAVRLVCSHREPAQGPLAMPDEHDRLRRWCIDLCLKLCIGRG